MPTSTTIQIPKNAPITQTDGKVSREWARYFDLLTPQASSAASGVTSVTGTPPIASSGGTTPAISLNDTAVTPATYGDATHVGQFTVDQKGRLTFAGNVVITGNAVFKGAAVTLTNSQIVNLPTTPITLVAAQGANTRIIPVLVDLVGTFTAGAYTPSATLSYIYASLQNEETDGTNFIANDSGLPITNLTNFLSAQVSNVPLVGFTHSEPVNDWGNLPRVSLMSASSINVPLQLIGQNNGAGTFGGGNAANTLVCTPYYVVVTI